jgi:hypothetical protein
MPCMHTQLIRWTLSRQCTCIRDITTLLLQSTATTFHVTFSLCPKAELLSFEHMSASSRMARGRGSQMLWKKSDTRLVPPVNKPDELASCQGRQDSSTVPEHSSAVDIQTTTVLVAKDNRTSTRLVLQVKVPLNFLGKAPSRWIRSALVFP